tara:strand:+ start:217 stop:549 length:333 start_codon:yes stop_codon:yes gene_type:complete
VNGCLALFVAFSMHIGLENDYNNVHPHARCTVDNYIGGIYYNSEETTSVYLGRKNKVSRFNVEYGLVTGYSGMDPAPMIRIEKNGFFVAPSYETDGNAGVVVGIELKLNP